MLEIEFKDGRRFLSYCSKKTAARVLKRLEQGKSAAFKISMGWGYVSASEVKCAYYEDKDKV